MNHFITSSSSSSLHRFTDWLVEVNWFRALCGPSVPNKMTNESPCPQLQEKGLFLENISLCAGSTLRITDAFDMHSGGLLHKVPLLKYFCVIFSAIKSIQLWEMCALTANNEAL